MAKLKQKFPSVIKDFNLHENSKVVVTYNTLTAEMAGVDWQ